MKSLLTALLLLSTNQVWAGSIELINTPHLDSAVRRHYNMGRHSADSGGISSIKVFKNTGNLQTFFIVKEAMRQDPVSVGACWDFGEEATNECVKLVLRKSEDVRANYQVSDISEWLKMLNEWDFDHQWSEDLGEIERAIFQYAPAGSKSYSYGYDGIADVWTTILISEDKQHIMVISSDYGA